MELLSPAGGREALEAAVACGADAVYLGYTAFGARSYAGNFDAAALYDAVAFAHERGRKIYATVNTLVKPAEIDDLCDVFELLLKCGADAALLQDMGAVRIARERFPELTLHASTQMTVNNAQGARLLKSLGFSRIVPARECALSELRRMADTGVEIEAFAHGALCVSISGQCLFSGMVGGRSGNRGRCAQPCRLPYAASCGAKGYLLSTKDLMLLGRLPELRDAGVCSLKLEGRMKRPEYVGVVTRVYRAALDALERGEVSRPDEAAVEALSQAFNRGGFTEGYAAEKSHAALMSWARPNHNGVYMGRVVSVRGPLSRARMERALHDGDGLQRRGDGESDFTYSGADVPAGGEATLRIAEGARPGDAIYRLTDARQAAEIRAAVASGGARVPLAARLRAMPGETAELTLTDPEGRGASARGAVVRRAETRALDRETAEKQLSRMGGTPYALASLDMNARDAFLTAAELNALRRDALAAMRTARTRVTRGQRPGARMECAWAKEKPLLLAQGERLEDAAALLGSGADAFIWQPQDARPEAIRASLRETPDARTALFLPEALSTAELDALHALVCENAARFSAVIANNIGVFALEWPVPVWGGQGLNVMNADAAAFYGALGARRVTVSCEASFGEIREIAASGANIELEAYGRARLMLLSHCPRRTMAGDTRRDARCDACARDGGCPAVYTDRRGYRFPARRTKLANGCVIRLYNSLPTDLSRHAAKLRALGCSLRLAFTDEPLSRQAALVRSFRRILEGGDPTHEPGETTSGRFIHPVE